MITPETKQVFEAAKNKSRTGKIIDCIICNGSGKIYDTKIGHIRSCAGCRGTGDMKNPKFKHQQA